MQLKYIAYMSYLDTNALPSFCRFALRYKPTKLPKELIASDIAFGVG